MLHKLEVNKAENSIGHYPLAVRTPLISDVLKVEIKAFEAQLELFRVPEVLFELRKVEFRV